MNKESFVLTLTVNGEPVVLHFTGGSDSYEASALNTNQISPFSIRRDGRRWHITTTVPDHIRSLENKLSVMINGCTEVQ